MIVDKSARITNSLSLPSTASFVINCKSRKGVIDANNFAKKEGLPLIALGGGTNIIPNNRINGVVLILDFDTLKIENETVIAEAGNEWDSIVQFAVSNHLSGIEALSWIPGRAGAAPVQNIGAYGREISNVIEEVEAYDRENEEFVMLSNKECQFSYRNSIFKEYPNKFIIVSMTLKLSKEKPKIPTYKDIENYFSERGNDEPSLREIREAIIKVRKGKLPDPEIIPNVGSYFTNPVLENEEALSLKNNFPDLPIFPFEDKSKIPAAWLIEQAGLKGKKIGKVEIYSKNALILINPNQANFADIMEAEKFIQNKVFQKFNILLKREPVII